MASLRSYGRILALVALAAVASAVWADSPQVIRGRLEATVGKPLGEGKPLALVTLDGQRYVVEGDPFSEAQLRDPRLAGRLWELEGTTTSGGHFQVRKLFTIKDGRRHVVKYYCEVCHIYTHEPGRCMCCQDETELREIPES